MATPSSISSASSSSSSSSSSSQLDQRPRKRQRTGGSGFHGRDIVLLAPSTRKRSREQISRIATTQELGQRISKKTKSGSSTKPLTNWKVRVFEAIRTDDLTYLRHLVQEPYFSPEVTNKWSWNPVMIAASCGKVEAYKILRAHPQFRKANTQAVENRYLINHEMWKMVFSSPYDLPKEEPIKWRKPEASQKSGSASWAQRDASDASSSSSSSGIRIFN